jgi:hypothetical protein
MKNELEYMCCKLCAQNYWEMENGVNLFQQHRGSLRFPTAVRGEGARQPLNISTGQGMKVMYVPAYYSVIPVRTGRCMNEWNSTVELKVTTLRGTGTV